MLLYFLFPFLFSQVEVVPTVVIEDKDLGSEVSRSVLWPTKKELLTPAVQLPFLEEAINTTNGLQSRTQGSPTFSIRGSAQSGRSLVLYDQTPLNFASGYGAPRIFLPKETLHSINVIKGPASLFYGSQALAGAIDFVSKKYDRSEITINFSDTNESFLPWRQGDLGHQSYQLATPLYSAKSSHWQTSIFYEDSDGEFPFQLSQYSGVRNNNSSTLSRGVLKGFHQWDSFKVDFNSIVSRQIQQSPGPLNNPTPTSSTTEGLLLSVTPQFFINDGNTVKSRVSYILSEAEFLQPGFNSTLDQKTFSLQNEWTYDLSGKTKLQLFADGFFHRLHNSFVGKILSQDLFEAGPLLSFHSFEKLQHQIGGRYLFYNNRFLPSFTTHYFFENGDTWVGVSQGFRNPTLMDLYAHTPFSLGNSDLREETSTQYEWGIKSLVRTGVQYDVRIFHMQYDNYLESFEVTPGIFSKLNAGEGYSQGLDLESNYVGHDYSFGISYNYLDTKNKTAHRAFRLSPRHQLTLNGSYQFSRWGLQIQNTHWYDFIDVVLNQPVKLEDWQQWNFFFNGKINNHLTIDLGLINAFNEGKQLTLYYPEPQRQYWLQARYIF